jgi:hypothetical protein
MGLALLGAEAGAATSCLEYSQDILGKLYNSQNLITFAKVRKELISDYTHKCKFVPVLN